MEIPMRNGLIPRLAIACTVMMGTWWFSGFTVTLTTAAEPSNISLEKTPFTFDTNRLFKNRNLAMVFSKRYGGTAQQRQTKNFDPLHQSMKSALLGAMQLVMPFFQDANKFKALSKEPEAFARKLGFDSIDQVTKAEPGPMLMEVRISLENLVEFKNKNDLDALFINPLVQGPNNIFALRLIVPLLDVETGKAKSSITFALFSQKEPWRWVRRGAPMLMTRIDELKAKYPNEDIHSLIKIPGFNLRFLGYGSGDQLSLIFLDNRRIGTHNFTAGKVWASQ